MATTKTEIIEALLQRMDDAVANGTSLPWQKPWEPKFGDLSAPQNPTTERIYSSPTILKKPASGPFQPDIS
ncbi:ArdC family protein [Acidithiobacillus ferrivorans]|nr:ArdC family protein [Acidithiobacillus ferrivorans]